MQRAMATIGQIKAASAMTSVKMAMGARISPPMQAPTVDPTGAFYRLARTYLRPQAELADRFSKLAKQWEDDTAFTSALDEIVIHQDYQEIIGMGPQALPFVLRRVKADPARWFWALRAIVGHDVAAGARDADTAADLWIAWGRDNGYLSYS